MQKVFNALSAVAFLLVLAIGGSGVFTYLWLTNPVTQEKIKGKVVEEIKDSLKIPGMTGGAAPIGTGGGKKDAKLPF